MPVVLVTDAACLHQAWQLSGVREFGGLGCSALAIQACLLIVWGQ